MLNLSSIVLYISFASTLKKNYTGVGEGCEDEQNVG